MPPRPGELFMTLMRMRIIILLMTVTKKEAFPKMTFMTVTKKMTLMTVT